MSSDCTREELVVTLMAVLELLHDGKIRIHQEGYFGDIAIEKREVSAKEQNANEPE